jgi:hypothetical protein
MKAHRGRRDKNPLIFILSNRWRGSEWPASHPSHCSWYAMSKLVNSRTSADTLHVSAFRHFFIMVAPDTSFIKQVRKCMQYVNTVYSQLSMVTVVR